MAGEAIAASSTGGAYDRITLSEGHTKQPAPCHRPPDGSEKWQCWQCWCVVHLVDFWRAGGLRGERHAARSCSDGEGMDFHWCCELMQGGSAAFVLTENHVSSWSFRIVARLTVWDSGRRRTQGMHLLQWLACWDFSIETIKLIPPSDGHCSNVSISTCSLFSRLNNIMFICLRQLDLPGNWVIHRMSPS